MRDFFHNYDPVFFQFPIDGDCLNRYDGEEKDGVLYIPVRVKAADNACITVNDIPAVYDPETYTYEVTVPLHSYRNTLWAIDSKNGYRAEIVVYKLHDPVDKFYFVVDDCILFLSDLTAQPEKYPSMFLHPFLAPFKKAHDLYGAHVHLNLYYEFNAESARDFSTHKDYFDLSMMTDRYKGEFEANAHWLTLSYHAHANYPDMPARYQSFDFVRSSIEMTHREIRRFAGAASLIPATTSHWGNGYIDSLRAFRQGGYRIKFDSFRKLPDDEAYLSYYGRDGLPAYLRGSGPDAYNNATGSTGTEGGRDLWKDNREDIIFCHTSMVLNQLSVKTEDIPAWLDAYRASHPKSGILNLMIHEEYYYEDYISYIPDCGQRVLTAIQYAYDHGYRSVPIQNICLE